MTRRKPATVGPAKSRREARRRLKYGPRYQERFPWRPQDTNNDTAARLRAAADAPPRKGA